MAEKGWIKVHRKLQECFLWYGERFSKGQAWVDLLLLANHSEKKILFNGKTVLVSRGQYLTSTIKLAEKWKWDRKTVAAFLKLLEKERMIVRETDNKKTLITIQNYEFYQSAENVAVQQNECYLPQQLDSTANTNKNVLVSNSKKSTSQGTDIKMVIDAWNDLEHYGIKTVSRLSSNSQRYQRLAARINEYSVEKVLTAIEKIKGSDFLQGKNSSGWTIMFDWFVLPNNFPKVLDGNYDNKKEGDSIGCIRGNDRDVEEDAYANNLYNQINR